MLRHVGDAKERPYTTDVEVLPLLTVIRQCCLCVVVVFVVCACVCVRACVQRDVAKEKGIPMLEQLLRETNDIYTCELVTGILWNLSSTQVCTRLMVTMGRVLGNCRIWSSDFPCGESHVNRPTSRKVLENWHIFLAIHYFLVFICCHCLLSNFGLICCLV